MIRSARIASWQGNIAASFRKSQLQHDLRASFAKAPQRAWMKAPIHITTTHIPHCQSSIPPKGAQPVTSITDNVCAHKETQHDRPTGKNDRLNRCALLCIAIACAQHFQADHRDNSHANIFQIPEAHPSSDNDSVPIRAISHNNDVDFTICAPEPVCVDHRGPPTKIGPVTGPGQRKTCGERR